MRASRLVFALVLFPLSAFAGDKKGGTPEIKGKTAALSKATERRASKDGASKDDGGKETRLPKKKAKPKPICLAPANRFTAGSLESSFALTTCGGDVAPLAIDKLSLLAQPKWSTSPIDLDKKPLASPNAAAVPLSTLTAALVKGQGAVATVFANAPKGPEPLTHTLTNASTLAPASKQELRGRVDEGMVLRLGAIAKHFGRPGKPAHFVVVSGYRPGSRGSLHAKAKAFDVRVEGVSNETLVAFCKLLEDTGCGYYPNSTFVHVDVRRKGAGHVSWIDVSGPGETAHYVSTWPLKPGERSEPEVPTELVPKDLEDDGHGGAAEEIRPGDEPTVETTWLDRGISPLPSDSLN